MPEYQSYEVCGIDTKRFYNELGTSITEVSVATGVNRASVTGVAVGKTSKMTVERVVPYLSKYNDMVYQEKIKECREEIYNIRTTMRNAWKIYRMREVILDEYYRRYKIKSNYLKLQKVSIREIFRKAY